MHHRLWVRSSNRGSFRGYFDGFGGEADVSVGEQHLFIVSDGCKADVLHLVFCVEIQGVGVGSILDLLDAPFDLPVRSESQRLRVV